MPVLADLVDALRSGSVAGRRPHRAAAQRHPDPAAAAAVRQRLAVRADRDQPLRRARPGLVLERHPHLRAHRHPLRRPDALGDRQGRRGHGPGAAVPAGRAGRGARLLRRDQDPDFLLEVEHVRAWEAEHGPLPDGGWLLYRTGWDARSEDAAAFLNADETGPHTPGISVECARWLAEESPVLGVGVETVGTDAGAAHSFDPPFPCHSFLLGRGQVRADPAAEPGPAAGHRRGGDRRAAADRRRLGQPGAGAGAGRAVTDGDRRSPSWSARLLRSAGRRARVRGGRQRELPRHQRAARRRRAVSWRPGTRAARRRWPTPTPAPAGGSACCRCTRAAG